MRNPYEIKNTRDMLDGALNRMTITDDPTEIETKYAAALAYIQKIKELNETRVAELIKFRAAHPEYKQYE